MKGASPSGPFLPIYLPVVVHLGPHCLDCYSSDTDIALDINNTPQPLLSISRISTSSKVSSSPRRRAASNPVTGCAKMVHPTLAFYDPDIALPYNTREPNTTKFEDIITRWSDNQLEVGHDYIQHLFPLPEPSAYNAAAPLLTAEVRHAFMTRPELHSRLFRAWVRMMGFYGFECSRVEGMAHNEKEAYDITTSNDFESVARASWLQPRNHNQKRITRQVNLNSS